MDFLAFSILLPLRKLFVNFKLNKKNAMCVLLNLHAETEWPF